MRTADLQIYGLPSVLVESWCQNIGEELLPLQEEAVRDFGLMDGGNLIISAPTSSGKTFCGEIAMAKALANGHKAVCLVPLKALAEERYADFKRKYESPGLKTIISSGDHHEFDKALLRGEFDLGVIIFEKMNQILTRNIDILSYIDLVVVDELQMICDDSRGAALELVLLKILKSSYNCRIIGLSAALSSASKLAEWLNAGLLSYRHRPVDLHQGVLWEGCFSYRGQNTGEKGSEKILEDSDLLPEEQMISACRTLLKRGERVLVFLKGKAACRHFAEILSQGSEFPPAQCTIDKIKSNTATALSEPLIAILQGGTAFHHADLSHEQRQAVEEGYKSGEIKILFATTTLSMGLNLPATTVILEPFKFRNAQYGGQALPSHLNWAEYENMCGRAGRLKYASQPGKAIILVSSEFEREVIWSKFVEGRMAEEGGKLHSREITDLVLDLVCSGICRSTAEIKTALSESFSGCFPCEREIGEAVEFGMIRKWIDSDSGNLSGTALGCALAGHGLSCKTSEKIIGLLEKEKNLSEICWLYEFVNSSEMAQNIISGRGRISPEMLYELSGKTNFENESAFRLKRILETPELLDYAVSARIAQVLALDEWCHGIELSEIENRFQIPAGGLLNASETCAWLAESSALAARIIRSSREIRAFFKRLSFSLRWGLEIKLRPLWKFAGNILRREELYRLYSAGIRSVNDLEKIERPELEKIIGALKASEIIDKIEGNIKKDKESNMYLESNRKLVLDGRTNRDRLTIRFFGRELPLTLKSFKYLAKLACAKYLNSDKCGWLHKDELEPGFNQARYIYNLKKELGLDKDQSLLENNRSGYYRLNLNTDEIHLNLDNLKNIPDFELKTIAEQYENLQLSS